jgi:hypothetical protein
MLTELREILSLAARALLLMLHRPKPPAKRCIYLERRDGGNSDGPFQNLWTPRGSLQMRKVRTRRRH